MEGSKRLRKNSKLARLASPKKKNSPGGGGATTPRLFVSIPKRKSLQVGEDEEEDLRPQISLGKIINEDSLIVMASPSVRKKPFHFD